MTFTHIKTS